MQHLRRIIRKLQRRRAQSLVEYALILALLAIVVVTGLTQLGSSSANAMNDVTATFRGESDGQSGTTSETTGNVEPVEPDGEGEED